MESECYYLAAFDAQRPKLHIYIAFHPG